ncbi:MAG: hypothetical protein H6868_10145 [Rhodospirillales bacterium]|nr:hypothetical protein [Rhodospirillales bacterium]
MAGPVHNSQTLMEAMGGKAFQVVPSDGEDSRRISQEYSAQGYEAQAVTMDQAPTSTMSEAPSPAAPAAAPPSFDV